MHTQITREPSRIRMTSLVHALVHSTVYPIKYAYSFVIHVLRLSAHCNVMTFIQSYIYMIFLRVVPLATEQSYDIDISSVIQRQENHREKSVVFYQNTTKMHVPRTFWVHLQGMHIICKLFDFTHIIQDFFPGIIIRLPHMVKFNSLTG